MWIESGNLSILINSHNILNLWILTTLFEDDHRNKSLYRIGPNLDATSMLATDTVFESSQQILAFKVKEMSTNHKI